MMNIIHNCHQLAGNEQIVFNTQHVQGDSTIQQWCNNFHDVWKRSDQLFSLICSTEDYYKQPIKLRLPVIFYLGHLPCFSWVQFRHLNGVNGSIDDTYDELFVRGVDPDIETGIVKHNHSSQFSMDSKNEENYWRSFSVASVIDYKHKVRTKLINILTNGNLDFNDVQTLNVLNIAMEHEMLHQETLMYMFVQLPIESLRLDIIQENELRQSLLVSSLPDNTWVILPGGQTSLGKPYSDQIQTYSFGWDNEFPREPAYVSTFEIQSHPIRNGDFLQFIINNGYMTSDWWDEKVFQWITTSDIHHPATWTLNEGSYRVNFVLQRNIPIESVLDHPVLVSQVEAKAYCRWLSNKTGECIDLPTEPEWVYAMWDWSNCIHASLMTKDSNIDFRHLHTMPVRSNTSDGNLQWQGSAFEWTSSEFRPFSGYHGDLPSYPGYSSDFFDNRHFVMLGASFATNSTLIRRSFRNWYQDTYRYVFATFRCVKRINHTDHPLTEVDHQAIVASLRNTEHRRITSKYFYDTYGSILYTLITQMNEYYLFMQEFKLLQQRSNDIKSTIIHHSDLHVRSSSTIHLIELGCGDGGKIETLLTPWIQSMNDIHPFLYHPVDISKCAIDSLVQLLKKVFGEEIIERHIKPVCSTFDDMCKRLQIDFEGIRVVMIMGSTIGNFSSFGPTNIKYGNDAPVMQLLSSIRQNLQVGDWFVCAFDMCKDTKTIIRAYDDPKGVTAAFNFNLLARLNRELNFNFDIVNYRHCATYNPLSREMESWLISMKHQIVTDHHGFTMELQPYDAIQTELSTKYTYEDIQILMKKNSMRIIECYWTEDEQLPYTLCMAQMV